MISRTIALICWLVLASPTLQGFLLPVNAMGPWPRGGGDSSRIPTDATSSWSSYVTIDPSNMLSLLMKTAGWLFDQKLEQLGSLMHCDDAELNVVNRELFVHNFTVSIPSRPNALRIGKLHVTWDSYSRPCLDVEVEDVDILVEFTNLLLTRNNWNELHDLGFPPELAFYNTTTTASASDTELIRIGSLELQGRVALQTRSQPLDKKILPDDIVLNLGTIRDLNYKIRALAQQNEDRGQRRGCTSEELYDLIQAFFATKLKDALKYALEDIAVRQLDPDNSNSKLANHSKVLLSSAKDALLSYASDLKTHSVDKVKGKLMDLGVGEDGKTMVSEEEVDRMLADSLATIKTTAGSVSSKVLKEMKGWMAAANASRIVNEEEDDTIVFPDW